MLFRSYFFNIYIDIDILYLFLFLMGGIVFLCYWLFDLRLPTLEFIGYWVELGLGAEMRNSVRSHSNEHFLRPEVLG